METQNKWFRFLQELLHIATGFIKAQCIFFAIDLVILTTCFIIFNIRLSFLVALAISLLDLLPLIGGGLVFIPWILVCLIIGNSALALKLAILYIGLLILRQILDPLITGKQIGIKPLCALGASLLGAWLLGPTGLILGPLVAAAIKVFININNK